MNVFWVAVFIALLGCAMGGWFFEVRRKRNAIERLRRVERAENAVNLADARLQVRANLELINSLQKKLEAADALRRQLIEEREVWRRQALGVGAGHK
jgi:hypothetical protein